MRAVQTASIFTLLSGNVTGHTCTNQKDTLSSQSTISFQRKNYQADSELKRLLRSVINHYHHISHACGWSCCLLTRP